MRQADCEYRLYKLAKALAAHREAGHTGSLGVRTDSNGFTGVSDAERIEGLAVGYVRVRAHKNVGPAALTSSGVAVVAVYSAAQLEVDGTQAAIDQCEDYVRQTERILVNARAATVESTKG